MTNRSIGRPYKQFHDSGRFDVIVIGSGIGGMGTAALLAKAAGQRVLVLEKHYTAGGFTHVFRRPRFEWDVGVHYVGQVHTPGSPANALFEYLAEGRLSWNAMPEVYDRVNIDGLRFDYVSGREHLRDALVETFPRAARTRSLPATSGHLCLYARLTFPAAAPKLDPANLWIHPSLDFDRNLSAFDADLDAPFPFLYISFPSAKDPSFDARYPNRHTIEVVTLAPYERFSQWAGSAWKRRPEEYEATKKRLAERLLVELYRHVPAASGMVTTWELSTPLSTQHFANAPHGETYGLAHTPERFESSDLRPHTPIRNLFLTGQDIGMAGVMGALSGAVVAASAMLRRNMFGVVSKAARREARLNSGPVPRLVDDPDCVDFRTRDKRALLMCPLCTPRSDSSRSVRFGQNDVTTSRLDTCDDVTVGTCS